MKTKHSFWRHPAFVVVTTILATAVISMAETAYLKREAVREARAQDNRVRESHILAWAVWHDSVPIAKAALKAGADPNARFPDCQFIDYQEAGTPDPDPPDRSCVGGPDGRPLMPVLFTARDADIIKTLVIGGADVNARDDEGNTPLLFQARDGLEDFTPENKEEYPVEAIRALLQAGADAKARDKDGNTALHLLWSRDQFTDCDAAGRPYDYDLQAAQQAVQTLLRYGADRQATNKAGQTPIQILDTDFDASEPASTRQIGQAAMRQAVAGLDGLGYVVKPGNAKDLPPDPQQDHRTLENRRLAWAVFHGKIDALKAALQAGADPNFCYPDWQGADLDQDAPPTLTPQNTVAKHLELKRVPVLFDAGPEAIRVLVHAGANVNIRDSDGNTPLLYFAQSGNNGLLTPNISPDKIIAALLEAGADVNARNPAGQTALHLISYCSDSRRVDDNSPCVLACIRVLARHGADLNARDRFGKTVWQSMDDCQNYGSDNAAKYRVLLRSLGARPPRSVRASNARRKGRTRRLSGKVRT